ncbi:MAG: histidine kinase [Ardenticatenaceae bacterium]|nr:histidine kinase [Ardenticatenaceae bacterium]
MFSFPRWVGRLRWQLALSYAVVTIVVIFTLLLIEQVLFLADQAREINIEGLPQTTVDQLHHITPQVASYLAAELPDQKAIEAWLMTITRSSDEMTNLTLAIEQPQPEGESLTFYNKTFGVAVFDASGAVISQLPPDYSFSDPAERVWRAAMTEPQAADQFLGESIFAAVPIFSPQGERLGVLFVDVSSPNPCFWCELGDRMLGTLMSTGRSAVWIILIGIVFGIISTRGLTRRIQHLVNTAERWGEGELTTMISEQGADELGDLSRQLNRMARDLDALLQTRQQLAHLEERNRLARELHDAVKQQVFATSMQLASAQLALEQGDEELIARHLQEAKMLIADMKQELTGLIQELRPAALEDKGLVEAVRDYAEKWSRQHDLPVEVAVQGERPTPLQLEQTLFRIAQEGLSNIGRHSQASRATVYLKWADGQIKMRLQDDGVGFVVDEGTASGIGLASMQERVAHIGGEVEIFSAPGRGTSIEVSVPLK